MKKFKLDLNKTSPNSYRQPLGSKSDDREDNDFIHEDDDCESGNVKFGTHGIASGGAGSDE